MTAQEELEQRQRQEQEAIITQYRDWCAVQGFSIETVEPMSYGEVFVQHRTADGTRYHWVYMGHDMIAADSIEYKPKGARRWREPIWPNGR